VFGFQKGAERGDARAVGDVELAEADVAEAAVLDERLGAGELRVGAQVLHGRFAAGAVARRQVDEQRPVVERRLRVVEGELADCGERGRSSQLGG
jgi:hypothetical protein